MHAICRVERHCKGERNVTFTWYSIVIPPGILCYCLDVEPNTSFCSSRPFLNNVYVRVDLIRGACGHYFFFFSSHACTAAIPRRVRKLIDSNPKMIVTGLPMLEVKKEEGVVAYDPPLSASLKDVSSNVERVSSFDFCRTATSPVSNAAVHKLQGAKLWLQPIALIESLPRDSDLHRFGPS